MNGTGGSDGHDGTCGSGGDSELEGSGGGPPGGSGWGPPEGSCGDSEPEGSGWGAPVGSGWGPPAGSGWGPPEGSGWGQPAGSGRGPPEGSGWGQPAGSGWGPPAGSGGGPPAGSGWGPHEGGSGDNGPYTECGGIFSDDVGVLSSPNYPAPYPNNADCIYIVSGPANIYITYTLTNMDIEPRDVVSCDDSDGCSDSLKIWDCADGILMNEHCGCSASVSLPIGPIMAMGNSIRIR